jgi:hypothetical protein
MPSFMVSILIELLVVGLLLWIISVIPWPAPMGWLVRVLQVVIVVFAAIWLISMLAGMTSWGPFFGPPPPAYRR